MSLDPERREGLERARATALARDSFGIDVAQASVEARPFGVVVSHPQGHLVIVGSEDLAALGGLLMWMDRQGGDDPVVVFEHHAGVQARRLALLAPGVGVWSLADGRVEPAVPEPIKDPYPTPTDADHLVALIERCGAEVVIEDGIIRAEVAGLEVGRVVVGPAGSELEVGVGRFDREAGALLHADRPSEPTLADTVNRIAKHRQVGAPSDAVNRLARERWLRRLIVNDPGLAGLRQPVLVEPIPPRLSLLESVPAALLGIDETSTQDSKVLVICSVGVALDLVPSAADLVVRHHPDQVRFVVPARDRFAFVERSAMRLNLPVSFVNVEVPWMDGLAPA